jgi:hypothetical protein
MPGDADDAATRTPSTPPIGWYPDPSGAAQWRRWDGTSWGETTMPYGPPPPDAATIQMERSAWLFLRSVAPWGLVAPALFAIALAADSATFGPLRRYVREWWRAEVHHRPLPPVPATGSSSVAVSVTYAVVWLVSIVGIGAWLRFTLASTRVVAAARYPSRHRATWTCLSFFIPILGPLVALSASCAWLPEGHEARRLLAAGWSLVAVGELAIAALWVTTLATSSLTATWSLAVVCAGLWVAAAVELPRGLEAVADDHASLGVRRTPAPS